VWHSANRVPLSHFPRHHNVAAVFVAVAGDVLLPLHSLTSNSTEWQRWAGERGQVGRWGGGEASEAVSRTSFICITMINSKVCAREFLNFFRLVFVWIAAAAAASVSFDFSFPSYMYGCLPGMEIFAQKGKKQRESGISYLWTGSCLLALWLAHSCCVDRQPTLPQNISPKSKIEPSFIIGSWTSCGTNLASIRL